MVQYISECKAEVSSDYKGSKDVFSAAYIDLQDIVVSSAIIKF